MPFRIDSSLRNHRRGISFLIFSIYMKFAWYHFNKGLLIFPQGPVKSVLIPVYGPTQGPPGHSLSSRASNLYPTPCTVTRIRGRSGSGSTFCLSA